MLSNVTYRTLNFPFEKENASRIVDKKYRQEGYIRDARESSQGIASYLQEESSNTFGVFVEGEMYGTLSLVFDGDRGLPMDSIYRNEVDLFRDKNYKLGEVVQFATDKDISKKYLSLLEIPISSVPLFGYLLSYADKNKLDYLCISVNPKHATFYSLIGFKKFGELKHYDSVDAPAIAMCLSMKDVTSESFKKNTVTKMIASFFDQAKVEV